MIRKAVIVGLTLGALAIGVLLADSFRAAKVYTTLDPGGSWTEVSIDDGVVAVLRFEAERYPLFDTFVSAFATGRRIMRERHGQDGGKPLTARGLRRTPAGIRVKGTEVPLWFPFVIFSAYPAIAFVRGPLRRRRRRKRGECVACGYDLTGNVSGVCPECGTGL